ncbi:MAG: hypothetical protein ACFFAU_17780 [Candidatus Hodarchaeota archaeon]
MNECLSNAPSLIRIVQCEVPYFDGMNSIHAIFGNTTIGIAYAKPSNPQSIYLFVEFTQKIARIDVKNRAGTVINQTQLILKNSFLLELKQIIEFEDENNDSFYQIFEESFFKRIDLSNIRFSIQRNQTFDNSSENELKYQLTFSAHNLSYRGLQGLPFHQNLENLSFSFELNFKKDNVNISQIPTITLQPQGLRGIKITKTEHLSDLQALRLIPRIKYSCGIDGWDFSSLNSKLILNVRILAQEQILGLKKLRIADIPVTREILSSTGLLGKIKFSLEQSGQQEDYTIDQTKNDTASFIDHRFKRSEISFGSTMREFLNFTWAPTVIADDVKFSSVFQPVRVGLKSLSIRSEQDEASNIPVIFLEGGFVLPQGSKIFYDPEIQVEEINPIFEIISGFPNRVLLEDTSALVLLSGSIIGIVIAIRQRKMKRLKKFN